MIVVRNATELAHLGSCRASSLHGAIFLDSNTFSCQHSKQTTLGEDGIHHIDTTRKSVNNQRVNRVAYPAKALGAQKNNTAAASASEIVLIHARKEAKTSGRREPGAKGDRISEGV